MPDQAKPIRQKIIATQVLGDENGNQMDYIVGKYGVTNIEIVHHAGEYAYIPYVRVWQHDLCSAEFCQHKATFVRYGSELTAFIASSPPGLAVATANSEEHQMSERMAYVGVTDCGCNVATIVDDPDMKGEIAKTLPEWIEAGLTVERHPVEWVRKNLNFCSHR